MKETGIVRKIDDLGRIVLPIELRKVLGITRHDPVEIFVDGDAIILKKHGATCVFCGSRDNLSEYKGKHVCSSCAESIAK